MDGGAGNRAAIILWRRLFCKTEMETSYQSPAVSSSSRKASSLSSDSGSSGSNSI